MNPETYRIAAEKYRAAMPSGEVVEFALDGADRLGVSCHSAVFTPDGSAPKGGVGYGAAPDIARCGAWGELSEDFWAHRALENWPRVAGCFEDFCAQHGAQNFIDPLSLCVEAGSRYTPQTELEWVEIERFGASETVWVPAEFVACSWSDLPATGNPQLGDARRGRLITPITNGLGAGLDREQAILHGLLELLQRDGNGLSIRALATPNALDLSSIDDPQCLELLRKFDAAGVDVVVKVASQDFGMTGFYVSGIDRAPAENGASNVMALAGGEAVHLSATVGLRKALLEWAASRARIAFMHGPLAIAQSVAPPDYVEHFRANFSVGSEEMRTLESLSAWSKLSLDEVRVLLQSRVHRVENRLKFSDLPTYKGADTSKTALLELVVSRLRAAGLEIFVADFSPPDGEVCAVKVIVPGLEVETMSYGRIGARNLARLRELSARGGPTLAGISAAPEGALPILLPDAAQREIGGAAWFDPRAAAEVMGPFYSLYREPGRHALALWEALTDSLSACGEGTTQRFP